MWEVDYKESWAPRNWCFWTVVLEKTLESPLDCKEIQPVNPKGNQFWIFIARTDAEAEIPKVLGALGQNRGEDYIYLLCCSVTQLCLTLCNPMDCSTPAFPVLQYVLEFAQTHVHWIDDAIQPSLSSPSPPALNLSRPSGSFPVKNCLYFFFVTTLLKYYLQCCVSFKRTA